MLSIIIADDHPITSIGTKSFLKNLGYHIVGTYSNGISCLNGIVSLKPQLAIIDVNMPNMTGLEILEKLKNMKSNTKVIILTMHKEMSVFLKAKEFGCIGYLIKDFAHLELENCIKSVLKNEEYISQYIDQLVIDKNEKKTDSNFALLTFAEKKVIELVAQQKNNKEVAKLLFITEKTVEAHKRNIVEKLNLPKEKNALLIWAIKHCLD